MYKILAVSHEFPPEGGGAGVVLKDYCSGLSDVAEVSLVTNRCRRKSEKSIEVIDVFTIPKIRFLGYWRKLQRLNLKDYDVILLNDIGACLVAALFFPSVLVRKSVVVLHGGEIESIFIQPEFVFKLLSFGEKYITLLKGCKSIVAVSNFMKLKFTAYPQLSGLVEKIEVVQNGIDSSLFHYIKNNDFNHLYGIPDDAHIILTVSRVVKDKGYERMYRIVSNLISNDSNVYWVVVGEGPYLDVLRRKIDKDHTNNIVLTGYVPRENLSRLYSEATIFLLLSEFDESFGLVYLEANACGCRVVGNDRGGVADVIVNSLNGLKLPLGMSDSCTVSQLEQLVGTNSFDSGKIVGWASKFSKDATIMKLTEVLFEGLSGEG